MRKHMRRVLLVASCLAVAACSGPAGQDGKPCTVKDNGNGTATITCPDGTKVDVSNGAKGTDGTNGTNGTNGMDGTSCTVTANPDAGTKVISCSDGTTVTLTDGRNGTDANAIVDFAKMTAFELSQEDFAVTVQSVSNAPKPVVRFTVKTAKGQGVRNIAAGNFAGIALLQLVPGSTASGVALDTWVSHITNCATCTSSTETASATTLVDNGDGTYVYTFAKDVVNPTTLADGGTAIAGVAFDANAVHRFGMRLGDSARANPYRPVDVTFDYIPATGANVDGQNDKVNGASCLTCHTQWRANAKNLAGATPFHGGQRYDVKYCVVCHNNQRKYSGSSAGGNAVIAEPTIDGNGNMTPPAGRTNVAVLRGEAIIDLPVFSHKIHAGEHLSLKGNYAGMGTEITEFMFPQDVRNCAKCHNTVAKADNWKNKPSRRACGACHDGIDFVSGQGHGPSNLAQANDNQCTMCHDATFIATKHLAVALPDPNSTYAGGTNNNTNASYIGNILNPPAGARVFKYDLASVTTVAASGGNVNPVVKFRFTENDAGVAFNQYDGGTGAQLLDNFVGAPSIYCVWAMPQDGISRPADFNASSSVYLRSAWAGTATGTSASTMTGPDSSGYYTVTITGTPIPPTASMLTCGIGYSYSLASTQPLTQTNVTGYAYNTTTKVGGLAMPPTNVWRVASTGVACSSASPCPDGQTCDNSVCRYTGRRNAVSSSAVTGHIVETSKCADCHNQLGVSPTYHAGQRNDGPTCSFCHTQNRTSSAWTAGSESFIHAIHAAQRRTVPYNWHAVATTTAEGTSVQGFFGVEYPGKLNYCESCHNPGFYDFSNSWYSGTNLATRLQQTVGTGTYDAVTPTADGGVPSLAYSVSPYVVSNGTVNYGAGYGYNVGTQAITQAASTTLVISPVANTCFGCHDSPASKMHMENNGATIYGTRAQAATNVEQCLICHGPGKTAGIREAHYQ